MALIEKQKTVLKGTSKITKIKKRDGKVVDFNPSKVAGAIWKAARSIGGQDKKLSEKLAEKVIELLERKFAGQIPSVEDVQDAVEKVLIEEGHARTAKAFILYRQQRAEIRKEKMQVLEKDTIDDVDKNFDINALRVLKARYLRKDEKGHLIETPKQLFTRIAVHDTIPDLFYDSKVFDNEAKQKTHEHESFDYADWDEKVSIGKYHLNRYHLEAVKRLYDRHNKNRQMKVSWKKFFDMLQKGEFKHYEKNIAEYYEVMVSKKFMPNTPAIANFGNPLGMGSACFVIGIEDSLDSIMDALKNTAIVFKAGGGMGYNFSKLRPEGDFVSTTTGAASGPISFMSLFDKMTEVIKQGGIRRGANMGMLNSNHPDVLKFVTAKTGNKALRNFNISVLIMPDFWEHLKNDNPYPLINPRNGQIVDHISPKLLWERIIYQAWESAEPGVIFYDTVNKYNPFLKHLGPIVTTNPCGEVLLYPNEPCNLGSINVYAFIKENENGELYFDWDELKETTLACTKFLDNVIDVNKFPLKAIEDMSLATRKVGLGVMGVGDLLFELGLPYNTEEGREFMERLMEFITYWSKVESVELAKERGIMPYLSKSFYPEGRLPFAGFDDKASWHLDWDKLVNEIKKHGIRNGYTTIIAPTGSISMIAGVSSGMEPVFSSVFQKNVAVGSFYYVDPAFERVMKRAGLHDEKLLEDVANASGSIQKIEYVPKEIKRVLTVAYDITPEDHVRALAAFQRWTDSSISKTTNFPADATVEHMKKVYELAYNLGCKGVTVFRDTSIKSQVLVTGTGKEKAKQEEVEAKIQMNAPSAAAVSVGEKCPECSTKMVLSEGCATCPSCGYSYCAVA
ncbi:TPA: adenosylcobalamin-dependent ribonucleoside-diphosphate reductase [archaeon]|uniref:Vitamin B12-dependent ribonucleotide reductase n=1 Tax=Candidatus Naiadarchaeum limnaeum TaxID=2756139 RepID=A0A832VAI1_9ARCH|nr:adenosylcobalamin-dependent ribonucleoside-diphosphate reductase [Candidatus Naiadarchaeum limnaeum]